MQARTKTFLIAGTILGGAVVATGVAVAQGGPDGWHGPRGMRGGMMGLMEDFDTNKDGKLTQAEIDGVRDQRLRSFDRDGNGQLNLDEYQALWADAMRRRMVRQFQAHDEDGNASITVEEFRGRLGEAVRRFDRNGDGELTADEMRSPRGRWRGGHDHDGPDRHGPRGGDEGSDRDNG